MIKIILRIPGTLLIIFGFIGFIAESSALFSGKEADAFGLAFALVLVFFGGLFFLPYRKKSAHPPSERKTKTSRPDTSINTVSILGMIFSALNTASGAGMVLFGGAFLSLLFSDKGESGWGLLGAGIFIIGVLLLVFGIIKLIGYVKLKKHKYSGFIIVLVIEIFSVLFLGFTLAEGFWILTALPFAWSVFIVVYLSANRNWFKKA